MKHFAFGSARNKIILIFRYGYGNWRDIATHIDTKTPDQAKDEYVKHFVYGMIGRCTW